jgi:hypothetical protein
MNCTNGKKYNVDGCSSSTQTGEMDTNEIYKIAREQYLILTHETH